MNLLIDIIILFILLGFIFILSWIRRNPETCIIDPMLEKLKRNLLVVEPRTINLQFFPSDESYTEDKQKVFICLKNEYDEYYSYDVLFQVCLHEISHAFCSVTDKKHVTVEFNSIHDAYRKNAIVLGLFNPDIQVPKTYCIKK